MKLTPCRAIFLYCRKCMADGREVSKCEDAECPLFAYRMGHDPARRGRLSSGGQKREKRGLVSVSTAVKKGIPDIMTINGRVFKAVEEKKG